MNSYRVGQVLFIVPKGKTLLLPMQVVEEITKKTLTGTQTSYMLKLGSDPDKTVDVADIEGEVFESSDKARKSLAERATKATNKIVDAAINKALEWYPGSFEAKPVITKPVVSDITLDDDTQVALEDGTLVRVKLPDVLRD